MTRTMQWVCGAGIFIVFNGICLYAAVLGGVFRFNRVKWKHDEQLKQECVEMVRGRVPQLVKGLEKSPRVITMDEFELMSGVFAKDERVTSLLYTNRRGEVRWHDDPAWIGATFEEFVLTFPVATNAIEQAFLSKSPKVRVVPGKPLYELAIPVSGADGKVAGIVDMLVSRERSNTLAAQAVTDYAKYACAVLLILQILPFLLLRFIVFRKTDPSNI